MKSLSQIASFSKKYRQGKRQKMYKMEEYFPSNVATSRMEYGYDSVKNFGV